MMTTAALDDFTSQRSALLGLAYRLLGSRADAEDVVQPTVVELAMMVAVENQRSRFNGGLGLVSQGFATDTCAVIPAAR